MRTRHRRRLLTLSLCESLYSLISNFTNQQKFPFHLTRQDEEIENDFPLRLQAMKMYLEHMSIDGISANLGVPKAIVEKWKTSFNMQQSSSSCEMIYEIFDDTSESNGGHGGEAKKSIDEQSCSLATLQWSESSDSEEAQPSINHPVNHVIDHSDSSDNVKIDEPNLLTPIKKTRQRRTASDYKRLDLNRWRDVPCRCVTCKDKFVGIDDLRRHVQKQHPHSPSKSAVSDKNHYGCGLCIKIFNQFNKLVCHSTTVHLSQLRLR